jgi:RNase adaptor protein for sRNA GlmZ degradation
MARIRTTIELEESYLQTLSQQAGEEVDTSSLNKAEASMKIDELQEKTGRGQ